MARWERDGDEYIRCDGTRVWLRPHERHGFPVWCCSLPVAWIPDFEIDLPADKLHRSADAIDAVDRKYPLPHWMEPPDAPAPPSHTGLW